MREYNPWEPFYSGKHLVAFFILFPVFIFEILLIFYFLGFWLGLANIIISTFIVGNLTE